MHITVNGAQYLLDHLEGEHFILESYYELYALHVLSEEILKVES